MISVLSVSIRFHPSLLFNSLVVQRCLLAEIFSVLSWQSKEECEYLISIAEPHMEKSTVVDSETGKSRDSRYVKNFFHCLVFG